MGRGYLFDAVVAPEPAHAAECRYPAFGAYACPGQDEDPIGGSNGEHGSSVRRVLFRSPHSDDSSAPLAEASSLPNIFGNPPGFSSQISNLDSIT
jgi:hypothetical protein